MEPNNFEKDFRDKLNHRTIQPSDKAWDRLDTMLSVTEEKKPKKNRKWLYLAASIVGFLLVGTVFFNQNKNTVETPKNVVIEENAEESTVKKQILDTSDSVKTELVISETPSKQIHREEKNSNQISNKIIKNESNQIAESSVIIKNNQEKQSINNQIASTENPKKSNVDQLLQTAENKVIAEKSVKPKTKIKVNASDLLDQVDGELELSFREKVITKVNKNYQTVKVAVANRNQE